MIQDSNAARLVDRSAVAVELHFTSSPPELFQTVFRHPILKGPRRALRGRYSPWNDRSGSFQWTPAVQALALLLLATRVAAEDQSFGTRMRTALSGERGSCAASLDLAISKQPEWLEDMFGTDASGRSLVRRILHRENPERKRPGPVVIAINTAILQPADIVVYVDNAPCSGRALHELYNTLLSLVPGTVLEQREIDGQGGEHPATFLAERDLIEWLEQAFCTDIYRLLRIPMVRDVSWLLSEPGLNESQLLLAELSKLPGVRGSRLSVQKLLRSVTTPVNVPAVPDLRFISHRITEVFESTDRLFRAANAGMVPTRITVGSRLCGLSMQFRTLVELDDFVPALHDVLERHVLPVSSMDWILQHPWWPILEPRAVYSRSTRLPEQSRIRYISSCDSRIDEWVADFYRQIGIEGRFSVKPVCLHDAWVCPPFLVTQEFPGPIRTEIDQYLHRSEGMDSFDNSGFLKTFFDQVDQFRVSIVLLPNCATALAGVVRDEFQT